MRLHGLLLPLVLGFGVALAQGQQAPALRQPNRLLAGKIIYVAPMPGQLDQWIIQDLRAWGRYQISGNSEGVDLVLRAQTPPQHIHYTQSEHPPLRRPAAKPSVLSLNVVNWVTGQGLWQCKILNRKQKKNSHPAAGPETEIDARGMKPDEIAERCVRLLGQYVAQLEQGRASK